MEAKLGQLEILLCLPFWVFTVKSIFALETWKKILKCYKMFWDNIIFIEESYLIKIKHLDSNNIFLKNAEIISGSQNVLADLPWENIVTSHFRIFIHFKIFATTFYVIQLQDKLLKSNFYLSVPSSQEILMSLFQFKVIRVWNKAKVLIWALLETGNSDFVFWYCDCHLLTALLENFPFSLWFS